MDLKATLASSYRNRLILIALAAMLYAAWCMYDALIGYPNKQEARRAFEQVREQYPDTYRNVQWPQLAEDNGWDGTVEPDEIDAWNIATQWIQFGIVFPIGAYCLFSLAMWQRRYVGADESRLYSHKLDGVTFDKITRIDAARWENKGIAVIYYDAGQGEQSLVLDDWKYQREPTDAIFDRLRENVGDDKITGLTEPTDTTDPTDTGDQEPKVPAEQGPIGTAAHPPADHPNDTSPTASG